MVLYLGNYKEENYGCVNAFDFTPDSQYVCYVVNEWNLRVKTITGGLILQMGVTSFKRKLTSEQ